MPVTFGSVGDIISVCLLVKDLVDALDKARGSKAEYQSLIRELWILDRSLLEIDLLTRTHGGGATPELEALCETAKKAVDRCKELVSAFSVRLQKYQKSLGENEAASFIKATSMKLRWSIGEKDSVDRFRAEITAISASLQMLLATASVRLLDITGRNMKDHMTSIKQLDESNVRKQDAILTSINDRLDDTNRLIASGSLVTANIAEALRLDWLRQLGTELKVFMRRIIAMNIATYHAVISIQSALPGRLERSLVQEPFVLEDAIGRIAPVHLQFVSSWDAFNAVLEIRFREMQGFEKVKEKQYCLQDKATKRDIEQSRSWERAFLPGQRIEMSFLFDTQDSENSKDFITCPGCQTLSTSPTHVDIQCENCQMWFRRVTVLQDVDLPPQAPVPSPWRSGSKFGKPGFTGMVSGPVRSGKRRAAPADVDGEDDFREFKRVRLITKRERMRSQGFGKKKGSRVLRTFSTLPSSVILKGSTKICESHEGVQTLVPQVQGLEFTGNTQQSMFAAAKQSCDHAEIVRGELEKARQAGLISKAAIRIDSYPSSSTESNHVEKVDSNQVASRKEKYWDGKWFSPEMSETGAKERQTGLFGNKLTNKEPLGVGPECRSSPQYTTVMIPDQVLVEYPCFTAPVLQAYFHPFYNLDPAFITLSKIQSAKDSIATTVWSLAQIDKPSTCNSLWSRKAHTDDFIWPFCALSVYVSSKRLLGFDKLHWSLIASAEALYGTPFRLPSTPTVFYGSSICRWIFDWTCHYFNEEPLLHAALDFWKGVYTMERNLFMLVHSQNGLWRVSEKVYRDFSHFIVCYRCFWWQLLNSMATMQMPDGQDFSGITSETVGLYSKAFLKQFFVLTPGGVSGKYKEVAELLNCCSKYLAAGIEKL